MWGGLQGPAWTDTDRAWHCFFTDGCQLKTWHGDALTGDILKGSITALSASDSLALLFCS